MKQKTRLFAAAFLISLLIIGMLCGFMAVDFSTQRYSAEVFGELLLVSAVGEKGITFSLLGQEYFLSRELPQAAKQPLEAITGWLPPHLTLSSRLTRLGLEAWELYRQQPEEDASFPSTYSAPEAGSRP
ncbi:hypothetical protein U6B65_10380 [Oscillospiraceae bacterium MB08-C2-2]|nr:hypothetical protein U6B65_10380 [Oscillospiraceae bacterium MB08-C2-2]